MSKEISKEELVAEQAEREQIEDEKRDTLFSRPDGFDVVDAADIARDAEPLEKHIPGSKVSDSEYEYVDISEATSGVVGKIREIWQDNTVAIGMIIMGIACFLLLLTASYLGTVMIAFAFAVIAAGFVFFLRAAWMDRKKTEEEYKYAEDLRQAALKKLSEEQQIPKSEEYRESKDGS